MSDQLVTELVDHVFALAGMLEAEGDRIASEQGLTAARWLVLGALQDGPLTFAEIARRRGLKRQSVRESAQRLIRAGHVRAVASAGARTRSVELTDLGRTALERIEPERVRWAADLSAALADVPVHDAVRTLAAMREALGSGGIQRE